MRSINYYSRQSHKKALMYLKSGRYCDKREKQLIYIVVISSILLCFLGILFSVLPKIFLVGNANFESACAATVEYLGFTSGVFLVVQLFIKIVTTRLHLEAVNSIERFDNYVYDLSVNRMITRPMTEAQIENNASKVKTGDSDYANPYFSCETAADPLVVYNNQREIFVNEYHLMLYVKRFFTITCILFAVILFGFAVAARDMNFFVTLQKIFFPSLSIISLIVGSMIGYDKAMRFLQNTLTQFEAADKDPAIDKRSELTLRQNQDAIFQYRLIAPTVPMFLIHRYEQSTQKQLRAALVDEDAQLPKTSLFFTKTREEKIAGKKKSAAKKTAAKKEDKPDLPEEETVAEIFEPEIKPEPKAKAKKGTPEPEAKPEPKVKPKKEIPEQEIKPEPKAKPKKITPEPETAVNPAQTQKPAAKKPAAKK